MTEQKYTPEQQAQLDTVQKAIGDVEKQGGLHPIQRLLFSLALADDGQTWLHELPAEAEQQIWTYLEEIKGPELPEAVFTLLRVASYLDQELKLGKVAYAILSVGNDAVLKFDLMKTVSGQDLDAGKRDAELRQKTGGRERPQPAKVGDKAPEGAVRIDQLPGSKRRL